MVDPITHNSFPDELASPFEPRNKNWKKFFVHSNIITKKKISTPLKVYSRAIFTRYLGQDRIVFMWYLRRDETVFYSIFWAIFRYRGEKHKK